MTLKSMRPETTPAFLPWTTATFEDGRKAILNGIGDTICVSFGKATHMDERDFALIVEVVNAKA
jgi:hypothetical protein